MKITISGHHVKITQAIKQAIENKLTKVANHFPALMAIESVVKVEPNQQQIEVITQYEGQKISVRAASKELYKAIAEAAKKLEAALKHRKGTLQKKQHKKYRVPQSDMFQPS